MPAFDSISKKLAIPMVVLFELGWIIYIGGLGSYMHQQVLANTDRSDSRYSSYGQQRESDAQEVLRDPVLFSHYFALVGGQFVAVLFLIHAALPLNIASYVVGVLSSIMNVIYFVSVGYLINWSVTLVRYYEDTISTLQDSSSYSPYYPYSESSSEALRVARLYLHATRCVLAGTIIMAISWGIIQLLTFFYKPPQNKTDLWQVVREFSQNLSTSTSQAKAKLGELIRLSTVPLLILSAIGWAVCTAGLYRLYDSFSTSTHRYDFGTWATFFVTPLLYFAALFHAGCSGGASTMSGVFAAIFNVFFVLNMGSTVVTVCIAKYTLDQESISSFSEEDLQTIHNLNLALGGGIVCLLFWTIVHTAWVFYRFDRSADHNRLQSNGDAEHSQPIVHAQQNELYGPGDTGTTTAHSMASFVPGQQVQVPPPYAKHLESEMQPVAN